MKLTNTIRDAFVRSVMNDVPKVDHPELIRAAAMKAALAAMPSKVKALYKDPLLTDYVALRTVHIIGKEGRYSNHSVGVTLPCTEEIGSIIAKDLAPMVKAAEDDGKTRQELTNRLKGVAYGVSTRKALADALPEFVKYLPADEPTAIRSLPMIANVVSDLVKAGWPKEKAPKKEAVAA